MNLQSINTYVKKARKEISALNKRIGRNSYPSSLYSYLDFGWCLLRYGCTINQYANGGFYRLRSFERKQVLTYRGLLEFIEKCNETSHIYKLENKIEFNKFFSKFVNRGWLWSKEMTLPQLKELYAKSGNLIIKPIDECEGHGIELLSDQDSEIEGKGLEAIYNELKTRNVIIEERLYNHDKMVFNNNSINTIRINSLMDKLGNVHLFKPVLRAGVGDAIVDNYCAGGCIYEVDNLTGTICSASYSKKYEVSEYHPGTQIRMIGRKIPYWEELKKLVAAAHKDLPQIKFIGWDVAITENGPELIEGNHHPDYDLLEFVGQRFWWSEFKKYLNL